MDDPFGKSAPFIGDSVTLLEAVEKLATSLVIEKMNIPGGAQSFANSILNENLYDAGVGEVHGVIRHANELAIAARSAISELNGSEHPSFHENDAWNTMVRSLRGTFKVNGLPYTTNTMKVSIEGKASQFVAFIFALQGTFPVDLQRHQHSLAALNKAVAAAIRGRKRVDTSRGVKSEN